MTVQQLIDTLEQVQNKNLQVVIRGTDHTDYNSYNSITEEDIVERNVFEEHRDEYRRRLVIDGGLF